MQKILNKIFISVLSCCTILVTVVTTTYAWVGITQNSSISSFDLNLKSEKANDYSLLISGDDIVYSNFIDSATIKKQILLNRGIACNYDSTTQAQMIEYLFAKNSNLDQATTYIKNDNSLDDFYTFSDLEKGDMTLIKTNNYFKFDIYLKIEPSIKYDINTNIVSKLYLANISNSLKGTLCKGSLSNGNPFIANPSSQFGILNSIPNIFIIDSSYATRFSLSIYNPIPVFEQYNSQLPHKTLIFQGGTQNPSLTNGIYSLGGILPEENNLAIQEMNLINHLDMEINDVYRRNDLECIDYNKQIWNDKDNLDNRFGIINGVQTKIKITVCFWYEGWDADCISFINKQISSLNLIFSTNENSD